MKHFALFLLLACLLGACSPKCTVSEKSSLSQDSISIQVSQNNLLSFDSLSSNLEFEFDSLCISVEKQIAELPTEKVIVRAGKGKISRSSDQRKLALQHHQTLDSLAYKNSQTATVCEHAASSSVINPSSATALFLLVIILIGIFILFSVRNKF